MREIGHFPMSENPARFRTYILPVLDEIRAAPSVPSPPRPPRHGDGSA
jgi:hypothetical protein